MNEKHMENGSYPTYTIEGTREGLDTLIAVHEGKRIPLHSTFYPSRESEILKEMFLPEKYDVLIVLGTGLGYHLLPLREKIAGYRIVVLIDILSGIEHEIAGNRVTKFLTDHNSITFITGKDPAAAGGMISELIDFDEISGISVLEHPSSVRAFHEYYRQVKDEVTKVIDKKAGNMATRERFGFAYMKNILRHVRSIGSMTGVGVLDNAFKGYPAVIVSSAPSLEKNISWIKEHQKRFFIIAVDSALPVLQSLCVKPDLVITVDPQPYICEHFLGTDIKESIQVFSISSYPMKRRFPYRYVSMNTHPLSQLIQRMSGLELGSVDSGTGSVAGDAALLAALAGFSATGLVGFDFSFHDFKIYARGTSYQRRYSLVFQDRFRPVESQNLDYIMKSSRGYRFQGKFTRRSLLGYRDSLSRLMKTFGGVSFYSINDIGIPIEGVPVLPIEEFIRMHCPGEIPKDMVMNRIRTAPNAPGVSLNPMLLRDIILNDALLDELIRESLGTGAGEVVTAKVKRMIGAISG